MARPGAVIESPVIGDRVVFRQTTAETAGGLLEFDMFVRPGAPGPPEHVHPAGRTNRKGVPGFLQLSVFAPAYFDTNHIVRPPLAVQRVIFGLVAPFARLLGYRPDYPYPYPDEAPPVAAPRRGRDAER